MRATAATVSDVVDVYNGATGAWSTARLSVARGYLAAASVGNVALFAGGATAGVLLCREGRGLWVLFIVAFVLNVCVCCIIAVLFAPRPLHLSCAPLQVVVILMLWMCTTEKQGHGRRLSSAWRAILLQLYLSGTWLCSLGVSQVLLVHQVVLWMFTAIPLQLQLAMLQPQQQRLHPPPPAPLPLLILLPLPLPLPLPPAPMTAAPAAAPDVTPSTARATRAQQGRTHPTAPTTHCPAAACALPASSALAAPLSRASAQAARRQAKAQPMHPSALPSLRCNRARSLPLLCVFWWLTWFTPFFLSGRRVSVLQIQNYGSSSVFFSDRLCGLCTNAMAARDQ
jgi:hypothetical protein